MVFPAAAGTGLARDLKKTQRRRRSNVVGDGITGNRAGRRAARGRRRRAAAVPLEEARPIMAGKTAPLQRPPVHRSPSSGVGTSERAASAFAGVAAMATSPRLRESPSEVDVYLRRSYALVERLRRAVAERTG